MFISVNIYFFYEKMSTEKSLETKVIGVRVSSMMDKMIKDVLSTDTHLNESDLGRDALREFIRTRYPSIYEKHLGKERVRSG